MGQRQQPDHGAARPLLAVACQHCLEGALISAAREQCSCFPRRGGQEAGAMKHSSRSS
jgi:hypothetical protein